MSDSQGQAPSVRQLSEIAQKPDEDVVALCKRLLAYAESGELLGIVIFGKMTGGDTQEGQAGDTSFAAILSAFEDWKWKRLWHRNRDDE